RASRDRRGDRRRRPARRRAGDAETHRQRHRGPAVLDLQGSWERAVNGESLEAALARVGSPVDLLRNATARPYTFPVAPEFSNWRSEQQAWRETCALLDQSHHMADLFVRGPDALRLFGDLGVNNVSRFRPETAKQFVAVNHDGHLIGDGILFYLGLD